MWHLFLAGLGPIYESYKVDQLPGKTVLILIQLSIVCYLLDNWVVDPPHDSHSHDAPRTTWYFWALFEVLVTLSDIANATIFLLLRSALKLKVEISDHKEKKITEEGKNDIIEEQILNIDSIGVFLVPGFSGLMLSCSLDQGNLKALTAITSGSFTLGGFAFIIRELLGSNQIRMKKLRSAKIQIFMSVTETILSLSVFALSIKSYVIDQDGSIVPFTTVVLLASMS